MSLRQAIKGFIVVVAVMFGTTSAFAHAGHVHGQSPASASVNAAVAVTTVTPSITEISAALARPSSTRLDEPRTSVQSMKSALFHSDVAVCLPGACCCQGASSCGMGGHCCASMMPDHVLWTTDLNNHMRYHQARLGWVYPDIVIGLDRPPKA